MRNLLYCLVYLECYKGSWIFIFLKMMAAFVFLLFDLCNFISFCFGSGLTIPLPFPFNSLSNTLRCGLICLVFCLNSNDSEVITGFHYESCSPLLINVSFMAANLLWYGCMHIMHSLAKNIQFFLQYMCIDFFETNAKVAW